MDTGVALRAFDRYTEERMKRMNGIREGSGPDQLWFFGCLFVYGQPHVSMRLSSTWEFLGPSFFRHKNRL